MIFNLGPLEFYRSGKGCLDVYFTRWKDVSWGWEYGWGEDDFFREPWIYFRIGKLILLYFEKLKSGFEIHLLGFWWIK